MKKKLQIFSVLVLLSLFANSYCFSQPQKYWNEWINFSQSYFKIPITKNGIYRIDSLTLAHAGITAVDPRNFQLFFRGQEQYIYVKGEADGVFNSSDYLEFYGQKNDGSLDSVLYKGYLYNQTVRQPNPYYSLFSDTSAYFLTWNNLTSNKRIIDYPDTVYSLPSTDYFMRQDVIENHTEYQFGKFTSTNINFPDYEETEGWSGAAFDMGGSYTASYNTPNLFPAGNVMVKLAVMAESNDLFVHPNHEVKIKYKIPSGNAIQVDDTLFDGYTLFDPSYSIPAANIAGAASTDIIVSSMTGSYSTNRISVPYVVFKYPHNLDLEGTNYYEMYVPFDPVQPKSFFSFTNFNGSSPTCIYDLTEHRRIPVKKTGGVFKALVANATFSNAEKFCVVKTENQFLQVPSIKPVRGNGTFIDYSTLAVDSAYIIITNKKLRGTMTGADAYANYRSSVAGGSHKVLVADIDDLYDEFAYGIPKHPFAIRHFANFCVDKFPSLPQNLFLIGKSVQINLTRNSSAASDPTGVNYSDCMVPSMGFPTSDNMMIAVLNSNGFKPAIPMGRLAAKNIGEVNTYLQKVNDYEHPPVPNPNEWMKHIIHLAGGH
ncbi:MAG TPA: C25 family cysteine peptidase, partial [Bacteroidia bacterium]